METECDGHWYEAGRRQDGEQEVVRHRCSGCGEERFYILKGSRLIPFPTQPNR